MGHAVLTSHIIKEAQKVAKGVRGIKCLLGSLTLLQKDIRLFYGPLPSRSYCEASQKLSLRSQMFIIPIIILILITQQPAQDRLAENRPLAELISLNEYENE